MLLIYSHSIYVESRHCETLNSIDAGEQFSCKYTVSRIIELLH